MTQGYNETRTPHGREALPACLPAFITVLLALVCCSPEIQPAGRHTTVHLEPKTEVESRKAIFAYVDRTRGWSHDLYRIEFREQERNTLVFWVIFKRDKPIPGGAQNSFEVLVDRKTHKIENELHFE